MSYCLNPKCPNPFYLLNANSETCCHCGSDLLLQGRYRVVRLLGEGGFGKTFELDGGSTSKVLKVLTHNDPKAVSLFEQEAKVLSCLRHPGIPRVEAGGYFTFLPKDSTEPLHCLVMEKIEGWNLLEWLKKRSYKPISQPQAIAWLKQLAIILGQVHQQQYFHRDIKPSNIMLRHLQTQGNNGGFSLHQGGFQKEQLVLIDFGTVREVTSTYLARIGGGHQVTGLVSAGYTPPEQVDGRAVPQSDFYALGRTFVHLLTGRPPNSFAEDLKTGKLIWRNHAKHISKPLADLLDCLIAPLPGNRPQDTKEISRCIEEIESLSRSPGLSPVGVKPVISTVQSQRTTLQFVLDKNLLKKNKWQFLTVLVLVGFVIFGGVISVVSQPLARQFVEFRTCYFGKDAQQLRTLCGHTAGVNLVTVSPDGQMLASSSWNGTIKLWNPQTGKLLHTITGHSGWVQDLRRLDNGGTLSFSSDAQTLVSWGKDNKDPKIIVKLWNPHTGKLTRIIPEVTASSSSYINITPDGQSLVNTTRLFERPPFRKTIQLWRLPNGDLKDTFTLPIERSGNLFSRPWGGSQEVILSSAISPDSQLLATVHYSIMGSGFNRREPIIALWNLKTGELLSTFRGSVVFHIAFSPNNQTLAGRNPRDNTIILWNLPSGEVRSTLTGNVGKVTISFSSDGQTLVSYGQNITLWNLQTGELKTTLAGRLSRVDAIAISPNSRTLASIGSAESGKGSNLIELWNLQTGKSIGTLTGHSSKVNSITFSPNGKILVSGSDDKSIKIWRMP